jgi:hypothetical protein
MDALEHLVPLIGLADVLEDYDVVGHRANTSRMATDLFQTVLQSAQAKAEKDGYHVLPEGATMTFYVAKNGASMTVARVEAVKLEGNLVFARTTKRETFVMWREDVFAAACEGALGQPARRAGFG